MNEDSNWELLSPEVVENLRTYKSFRPMIIGEYFSVGSKYLCDVAISGDRVMQAYDLFWAESEMARIKNLPATSTSLDHCKLAAYLCFWLRRVNPVQEIIPLYSHDIADSATSNPAAYRGMVSNFILYGNEICALTIGTQLFQYLDMINVNTSHKYIFKDKKGPLTVLDSDKTLEFARLLKHKNISAQGLYMMFQTMGRFGLIHQRQEENGS